MKKLTQKEFDKRSKEIHGILYKCLDPYINLNTKLRFECEKHGEFEQTPKIHLSGFGCKKCSGKDKKNLEYLHILAKVKNGLCLSTEYINSSTKYKWKCKYEHIWEATGATITRGFWCQKCNLLLRAELSKKQNGLEELQALASKNNGKCLSFKYENIDSKYRWECKKGHKWKTSFYSVYKGSWCPRCRESKGERQIAQFLDKHNIQYLREHKFADCLNIRPLPFDFYIPVLTMCIEFDGEQHFDTPRKRWKKFKLAEVIKRDNIKTEYCKNNNINLLRIPYTEIENIDAILSKEVIE